MQNASRTTAYVAKQASAGYRPDATTWVKIKNRQYSQAVGREDSFDRPKDVTTACRFDANRQT